MPSHYQFVGTTETYAKLKHRFAKILVEQLLGDFPQGGTIVEFGPGAGEFAMECLERGDRYLGLDSSERICRQLHAQEIPIVRALLPKTPLPDRFSDLVYSSMVLDHMPTPSAAIEFVEEAMRLARPGGLIVLMFPNAYTCGAMFWEMDYTHGYPTSPRRVEQMCTHLGLEIVATHRGIHWLWVRPTPLHTLARHLSNLVMGIVNWPPVVGITDSLGLGPLLWKFRKTFFETAIVVARKPG